MCSKYFFHHYSVLPVVFINLPDGVFVVGRLVLGAEVVMGSEFTVQAGGWVVVGKASGADSTVSVRQRTN